MGRKKRRKGRRSMTKKIEEKEEEKEEDLVPEKRAQTCLKLFPVTCFPNDDLRRDMSPQNISAKTNLTLKPTVRCCSNVFTCINSLNPHLNPMW